MKQPVMWYCDKDHYHVGTCLSGMFVTLEITKDEE